MMNENTLFHNGPFMEAITLFPCVFPRSENVWRWFEVQPACRSQWAPNFALPEDRCCYVWWWRSEGDRGQPLLPLWQHYAIYSWKGPPWTAQGISGTVWLWPLRCQANRVQHLTIATTTNRQYNKAPLPSKGSADAVYHDTCQPLPVLLLLSCLSFVVYVILPFVLLFERTEINNVDMLKVDIECIIYAADSLIHTLRRIDEFFRGLWERWRTNLHIKYNIIKENQAKYKTKPYILFSIM